MEENSWKLVLSVLSGDCLQGKYHEEWYRDHPFLMDMIQIVAAFRERLILPNTENKDWESTQPTCTATTNLTLVL